MCSSAYKARRISILPFIINNMITVTWTINDKRIEDLSFHEKEYSTYKDMINKKIEELCTRANNASTPKR